jgi:tetratricopeptide (TPR) repeat protein
VPDGLQQLTALHALSRRQALMTLAALPAALITSAGGSASSPAAATELFLARCAVSLTSCWHLLRGSDLPAVGRAVSAYILPLDALAQQESRYQAVAARLATQAHRICGIITLHDNSVVLSMHHCASALRHAANGNDAASHASALISLASRYFYASSPQRAASLYEQASALGPGLPALLRSRAHAELAVVYGQLGREQDAIRGAQLAEDLYPDQPEDDPSFLYAEFTPASLVLEQGLAYLALAERSPAHGYQQKAADVFARIARPTLQAPERIRFEVVNHQADAAVLLDDLDAFERFMYSGLSGVALLGSRQRLKEMKAIWQRATGRWPGELRLKALRDGLQQAVGREGAD